MFLPGGWEWIVVAMVALIVFGPKRLPEIGRQLGRGIRAFKEAAREIEGHLNFDDLDSPPPPRVPSRVEVRRLDESSQPTSNSTSGYTSGDDTEYGPDYPYDSQENSATGSDYSSQDEEDTADLRKEEPAD